MAGRLAHTALSVLLVCFMLISCSHSLRAEEPGFDDLSTVELLDTPSDGSTTTVDDTATTQTTNDTTSNNTQTTSEESRYKKFQTIPEDLTTQEYVDKYLELAGGDADKAWDMAYADRYQEGFQNLERRDAEHYLWSKQDVDNNSYQWLPSMIRTTGYSVMKVGQYWGIAGVNKVRTAVGKDEIDNTTRPTMDEFVWGIKGSHDSLFGTGN